jgi:hypothetical protein
MMDNDSAEYSSYQHSAPPTPVITETIEGGEGKKTGGGGMGGGPSFDSMRKGVEGT